MKKLDPIRIIETIGKLGAGKSIKYAFIGSGCILAVVVPVCYAVTSVKSHGKGKEQNNASANKLREIEHTSECKKGEEDRDHAHRMEENAQVHEHHMEEIEAKKNADIEKMEKRAELRKERDAAKANQPLVDLHMDSMPESYHEALKNGTVHISRERSLGFSWLREGYDTGLVGPTDCGKSVFVMQVAMALARGRCDVNLSSEWHDIPPMPVVVFSLEQSNHEIREYYGSVIDNLSTLKLYAGSRITPAHIITVIKEEMEKAGTFKSVNGWQEVKFDEAVKGQYFCLEALSNYDGSNIACIAEFDIIDSNGKKIPRESWKISYADSEETISGNRTADKIYDLQESTFWQTVDNTSYPHHIVIDLGKVYSIKGFRMLPRAESGIPGLIKDYNVFIKEGKFRY